MAAEKKCGSDNVFPTFPDMFAAPALKAAIEVSGEKDGDGK